MNVRSIPKVPYKGNVPTSDYTYLEDLSARRDGSGPLPKRKVPTPITPYLA
jgi:hypothetical protein